jgi:UDP-GlcNAc3NAcA epimerase
MRVVTVVGARPQFIKAAPVSRALGAAGIEEVLVHTGQHYDPAMSDVFFAALRLPAPAHHLGVGSLGHGAQTGRMLERLEPILEAERPAALLVYGDTNSTLAGALTAAKLRVPVAHVEAGLRSFNRRMPEETNRVLTDHLASLLFAPTDAAVENLRREGITAGVVRTGDVMLDTAVLFRELVGERAQRVPAELGLVPGGYVLATIHRPENTDDDERWRGLLDGLVAVAREIGPVVWPAHPRTRARLAAADLPGVRLVEPLPYFELQALLWGARLVLTDSGGLQKEAAFHERPCVTLRDETEWVELCEAGVNRLAGADPARIVAQARAASWPASGLPRGLYGDGHTADQIVAELRRLGA